MLGKCPYLLYYLSGPSSHFNTQIIHSLNLLENIIFLKNKNKNKPYLLILLLLAVGVKGGRGGEWAFLVNSGCKEESQRMQYC